MGISIVQFRISIGTFNNISREYKSNKLKFFKCGDNKGKHFKGGDKKTWYIRCLITCFAIMLIPTLATTYAQYLQGKINSHQHTLNGNTTLNNLKVLHWNKDNSLFTNKLDDLFFLIDQFSPHIISLSEANYNKIDGNLINDYNIEYNDLGIGYCNSRVVTIIHKSIQCTRRIDLEPKYIAIIICDIKLSNKNNLTIISLYRQWNLPQDVLNIGRDCDNQIVRYNKIINVCESLCNMGKELIIVGDDNIDTYTIYCHIYNIQIYEIGDIIGLH